MSAFKIPTTGKRGREDVEVGFDDENLDEMPPSKLQKTDKKGYDEASYNANAMLIQKITQIGEGLENNITPDNKDFNDIIIDFKEKLNEYAQSLSANNFAMHQEESDRLKTVFLDNFKSMIDKKISDLPIKQQEPAFKALLDAVTEVLSGRELDETLKMLEGDKSNLSKPGIVALAESISTIYDYASEQLAVTCTNLYDSTPEIARKTVSAVTLSAMLYTYQTPTMREFYERIPYFGTVFQFMNRANNILQITSNSAITTTGIYYFLRNAGVPVDKAVDSVREMAGIVAEKCREGSCTILSNVPDQLSELQKASNNVVATLADTINPRALGNLMSGLVAAPIMYDSQESQLSELSEKSEKSKAAVQALLNEKPINANKAATSEDRDRFDALVEGDTTNPIIRGKEGVSSEEEVDDEGDVVMGITRQASNATAYSDVSDGEPSGIWQYGSKSSTGGKRMRKSRRIVKLRRTRKVRRARKGKMTKKGKKKNKTLKRYKNKFRR